MIWRNGSLSGQPNLMGFPMELLRKPLSKIISQIFGKDELFIFFYLWYFLSNNIIENNQSETCKASKFFRIVSTSNIIFPEGWLNIFFLFSKSFDNTFKLLSRWKPSRSPAHICACRQAVPTAPGVRPPARRKWCRESSRCEACRFCLCIATLFW